MTHHLKTWPRFFERVIQGDKTFEIRRNDRDYQTSDTLILEEWDPETEKYTGRKLSCLVSYILHGGNFGLQAGYVAMSIVLTKPKIK